MLYFSITRKVAKEFPRGDKILKNSNVRLAKIAMHNAPT
jgi:hypothetical protein